VRRGYQFVGTVAETTATLGASRDLLDAFPARLVEWSGLGFAGRNDERAVLEDACKEVLSSGQRQVVFVSGEAGIGKTTLCSVVASDAHRDGALVFYGRCDDELAIPYQPIAERYEALGPLVDQTRAEDVESDPSRFTLYSAVVDVLDAVTANRRLALIVLDDLHWTDAESLDLVRHLLQRAMTTPVLVIATFRDSDTDASHPLARLLADAHREPGCTRLALEHLDDVEMLTLLEIVAGHELDQNGIALRDALRAETAGNPFFVTEILRHLTETGVVRRTDDGRWTLPTDLQAHGLPVSVREVVGRRVERLGPEIRRALDIASIIGRDFELDLLAGLLDEPAIRTFERLAPAIDNALVSDAGGQFSSAHAIVSHAGRSRQVVRRRRR
jgi:predicted ATPase